MSFLKTIALRPARPSQRALPVICSHLTPSRLRQTSLKKSDFDTNGGQPGTPGGHAFGSTSKFWPPSTYISLARVTAWKYARRGQ